MYFSGPRLVQNNFLLFQSKRFRGKINIQRPRAPHYERARVIKLTEPYYESKKKNMSLLELCGDLRPKVEKTVENPFQKLLAKDCLNWFNHSRLVALFHLNPMTADEQFNAYVSCKKYNMHFKIFGHETLNMALVDTKFEAFTEHYVSHNILLFSTETNIKQMLKITKKFPQMILLCKLKFYLTLKQKNINFSIFTIIKNYAVSNYLYIIIVSICFSLISSKNWFKLTRNVYLAWVSK